jgi:hypothetical protein
VRSPLIEVLTLDDLYRTNRGVQGEPDERWLREALLATA